MAFTPRSPWLRLLLFSALAILSPVAAVKAQEIECIVPHKVGEGERPVYHTGETRQFQWKSGFPTFNLTIVQVNSETQAKTYEKIYGEPSYAETSTHPRANVLFYGRERAQYNSELLLDR